MNIYPNPQSQASVLNTEQPVRIVSGHGVASGRSQNSPYPKGSIELQVPFFLERGLDLSDFFWGTINLDIGPFEFNLTDPEITFYHVDWFEGLLPEHFSFEPCGLRVDGQVFYGWIYYPRPETKTVHFQSKSMIEVIMPKISQLKVGDCVSLIYNKEHLSLYSDPVRKKICLEN